MIHRGRIYQNKSRTDNRQQVASYVEELKPMLFTRRIFALLVLSVITVITFSLSAAHAANKAKASVKPASSNKVYVPATMVKGSLVTTGRSFYKTSIPEDALGGIRLGRTAREVLAKWGNPTRITLGSVAAEVAQANQPATPQYTPPSGGVYDPMLGALPSLPGMGVPGAAAPGAQQQAGTGNETTILTQEEVTWTYDLHNGITLEVILTDGIVTQITVGGVGPWGLSKTRTGIQLGDSYKLVLWVHGYPESQKYVGRFLRVGYVNKSRVLYTFLDKKLVGVTIALVDTEIKQ